MHDAPMPAASIDLTSCDREPIHIPGSIQPHGILLVLDASTRLVRHGAGDIEALLGPKWLGRSLADLAGAPLAEQVESILANSGGGFAGQVDLPGRGRFDVIAHRSSPFILVELEPAIEVTTAAARLLGRLEAAASGFETSGTLQSLCERAALEFRAFTGFDRVMIYRFLDDEAGLVVAEDRREGLHSFLHHHFPATDIPRQARALYLRNLVRVIPDVGYTPALLRPAMTGLPLDMSDSVLRSVSPIHIQYLKNMNVGASASISIIKDGALWGLVACHNETPKQIHYEMRAACRALAFSLGRQIKAKEEAEGYRERIRLRGYEDELVQLLSREGSLDASLSKHLGELGRMVRSNGVAVLRGREIVMGGACPPAEDVRALADWIIERGGEPVFSTDRLSDAYPPAQIFKAHGSGVLSIIFSWEDPWVLIWFRSEKVEVINWAGNPHKQETSGPGSPLTPRTSFEAWSETVIGQSQGWTLAEIEAAARLRIAIREVTQHRLERELNRRLSETLKEKDALIERNQYLIGEVNHRVQNSLQLVSSFLTLQSKSAGSPQVAAAIEEASRRLSAVALVHRRLYRGDQIELIDAARYLEELCADTLSSMGTEWTNHVSLDLDPVMLPTDRAISFGLVLTELIINANKYAYDGAPGPVHIQVTESRGNVQLVVADKGRGKTTPRLGFGSRMMDVLVRQLGGRLKYEDNRPGTRAILTAPVTQ